MAVSVSGVPYRVDASNQAGWWRPIDERDGRIYMAYNAWGGPGPANHGDSDTHTVYVARRDTDGAWTRGCVRSSGACAVYPDDVGHKQPSVAVDGDGHVHVFTSMHANNWIYYRSNAPGEVGSLVNRSSEMPDQGDAYTYPTLARMANGDLYLAIRAGPSGRLYRWNNGTNRWTRVATFASDPTFVVYPNDVIGDAAGNVHICWEWAYGSPDGLRHLGSYLRYEPAAHRFTNAAGTTVTAPATTTSPVVYQPREGTEDITDVDSPARPPGVQSGKLALSPATGRPAVAYRYRPNAGDPWRVRLAEWTGSAWSRQVVYAGSYSTYAAVDISTRGSGVRVYYAKYQTAGKDQAFFASRQADASWSETLLLAGVPIERLSVVRRGNVDHLYLTSPHTYELFYGTATW